MSHEELRARGVLVPKTSIRDTDKLLRLASERAREGVGGVVL